ncbi:MAG: hypothetical protein ACRD6X_07660 [Pyrinomonadaceae bacterium]
MSTTTEAVISEAKQLTLPQKREVLARLWNEDELFESGRLWTSVRFGGNLRVVAHVPEQEPYLDDLRELLQKGALARIENEEEGTSEIYGSDRTYYVALTPEREFAALLGSWPPFQPPKEINLEEVG